MLQEFPIEQVITRVIARLPYPQHITAFNLREDNSIVFTWRRLKFRVDRFLGVDEVQGHFLVGSDTSILLENILRS